MNDKFYCQNCGKSYDSMIDAFVRFGSNIASHSKKCYKCGVILKAYRSWYINIIVWFNKKFVIEKEYHDTTKFNTRRNRCY